MQRILLEAIAADDFFRLSFPLRPDRYARIESKFPQWPLLALDRKNRIVCGHDYVSLLKRRRQRECRGLRIDLDEGNGLLLNFNVKECLTGLNLLEQLRFVRKALPFFTAREIQRRAAMPFSVSELHPKILDALLRPPFGRLLASNRIGLKSARKLLEWPEGDRAAVLGVLVAAGFRKPAAAHHRTGRRGRVRAQGTGLAGAVQGGESPAWSDRRCPRNRSWSRFFG